MPETFSPFAHVVMGLARFIRPNEITFSGVNSTPPMLACLLAKQAYDYDFIYINVAGGVDPRPNSIPISSSDPQLAAHTASIFSNEDFYDLCTRGRMDLTFLGAAQIDGEGCANNSCIGDWHQPKVRLPGGGGGAVMLPTARRACTWRTEHSPRTFARTAAQRTSSYNSTVRGSANRAPICRPSSRARRHAAKSPSRLFSRRVSCRGSLASSSVAGLEPGSIPPAASRKAG